MAVLSPAAIGRELADTLAAIKRPPANRLVRPWYVLVLSVSHPYFVGRFEDGTELTILEGKVRAIVGRTWRVRQVLGVLVGDDWAAARDLA